MVGANLPIVGLQVPGGFSLAPRPRHPVRPRIREAQLAPLHSRPGETALGALAPGRDPPESRRSGEYPLFLLILRPVDPPLQPSILRPSNGQRDPPLSPQ